MTINTDFRLDRRALLAAATAGSLAPFLPESLLASISGSATGSTHIRKDGNRLVDGSATFPQVEQIEVDLPGIPVWLVSGNEPDSDVSFWVVQMEDGNTLAFALDLNGRIETVTVQGSTASPPVISSVGDPISLLSVPDRFDPSPYSAPASNGSSIAFVDQSGRLRLLENGTISTWDQRVLIDTRIMVDDRGRYLALAGPVTDRYQHAVLGDGEEAAGFDIFDEVEFTRIGIGSPDVIESNSPIWVDLDGNGNLDIIVPVSNNVDGARLVAYREGVTSLAEGPGFGRPSRWRHPLAVGPFGPTGENEIAAVRTPHIGGVVEFYQLDENRLTIAAELPGYTAHVIGSRNLDMGVAGDFDGDGRLELVVPTQDRLQIASVIHDEISTARQSWIVDLPAQLTTNLSATNVGNTLLLGAGCADTSLSFWIPA